MSKYRLKIGIFTSTGTKISGRRGRPTIHWYKNLGIHFFRFVTNHAFDRQSDGRTDRYLSHTESVLAIQWSKHFLTYYCNCFLL